jgi:cation diffusion facilitator family transporter
VAKPERPAAKPESLGTVLVALASNLAVAVAKFVAGTTSGSSVMISEGVHSVADSINEMLYLLAIRRSLRPADRGHPFGFGRERFFWAFLAAVATFVAGATFSIREGIGEILNPVPMTGFTASYVVLAASFVLEGASFLKGRSQLRREARRSERGIREHLRLNTDPTALGVVAEDFVALLGLLVAFFGLLLQQLTGSAVPDGVGSIVIGLLLAYVAYRLGRFNMRLLMGRPAPARMHAEMTSLIASHVAVQAVIDLLTMYLGPEQLLVAARVDVEDSLSGAEVEQLAESLDEQLRRTWPAVIQVFIHPMGAREMASG